MHARKPAFVRPHRRRPAPDVPVEVKKRGRLRYYVPKFKYEFDYRSLDDVLSRRLAAEVAEAHVSYLTRFSRWTAVQRFHALRRFAENTAANRELTRALKRCRSVFDGRGAAAWRQAVATQVTALEQRQIELTTFAEEIGNLFLGLDELTSRGIATRCAKPNLPKNYHASSKPRPGLVEQSGEQAVPAELLAQLEAHIDSLNLPIKGEEARGLLRALATQVPVDLLHDEVAVAEAIFGLNAKVLAEVRAIAEETFLQWRDVWARGQELLKSNPKGVAAIVKRAKRLPKHRANAPRRALFSPRLGDEAIANFLKLFEEQHGLYVPPEVEKHWPRFMKDAFCALGGREFFDACFALHRRGVAAAVLLYLVDSGANIATALSFTTDSEQATDDPNFVTLVSFKDRAGPDPIVKQLPLSDPGVKVTAAQALRDVRTMTQSRRDMYPELLGDALFVHTFFGEPSVLNDNVLLDNFRYMLRDRGMAQVYTPSAIRVAVAVEVSGKTGGDLDRVGRKLSHAINSAATPIYSLRGPVRALLLRKIREYATLLEVAFATRAPRGPLTLGYSADVAKALVDKAVRTGLGFLCSDPTAKGGTVGNGGPSCPEVGRGCPQCQVRVFMTDEESLSEMLAVHTYLEKKLDEYEEERQDAWVENWLEIYAFACAVIQKAKRSRFAYLMPAARRKAQQMLAAGFEPILVKE